MCNLFINIIKNLKNTEELFTRIIGMISALTILPKINYINNKPIEKIKYALI